MQGQILYGDTTKQGAEKHTKFQRGIAHVEKLGGGWAQVGYAGCCSNVGNGEVLSCVMRGLFDY